MPIEPSGMRLTSEILPVELGRGEGMFGLRVRDAVAHRRRCEFGEARELLAATLAYGVGQLRAEVAKEREGLRRAPFLAHEQHRDLRQQRADHRDRAHRLR